MEKSLLASGSEMRKSIGNEPELTAHVCQFVFFAKHLAGVLYEAWASIKKGYHSTRLSSSLHSELSEETQNALKSLSKYFGQNPNLVSTLRNKFSFHSDLERIENGIELLAKSEDFIVIVPNNDGTIFCGLAEQMINASMLNSINPSDHKKAVDQLLKEIVHDVSGWITLFCHDYCFHICAKFDLHPEAIDITSEVSADELVLPYFVKKNGNKV